MILGTRLTVDLSQHLQFPTDRRCWQPLTLYVTADTQPGFSYAWIVTRHICFEISRRGCSYSNQYWVEGSIYCTILHSRRGGPQILLQRYKEGRVTKTPSARQQCWPESFCKSGKFLWQVHYWLKNFQILCNTKYPDNMQSVQMNWKVSGQSKKCPDNLENVSG